ncbi:DUF3078 domain-containing protein [Pedobacter punctiformis]|uniref:DUF3078 domain-containing protein n=1 Tax=Pedobacter punctiformis TaxID=3004097 RepID=A0ABT4L9D0_9SPHI|nr:DUF3078 domain-containing protein [Pedobacter sp. HCMS5-2]MCZ4244527.1 DUF3078 domain-containing protein [Pedobacter sp. HCMS5-2]
MKKQVLLILSSLISLYSFGQSVKDGKVNTESAKLASKLDTAKKQEGWTVRGTNTFLLNQAAFSNWVAGGINSVALTARADYEFNLKRGKNLWENRILMGYGLRSEQKSQTTKVEDVIDLTSNYGYQIKQSNWYAAAGLNIKTQFSKGYDYSKPTQGYLSNFLAPGYLTFGLGVDYIPNDNFQINIRPLTSRLTFVNDDAVFDPDHDGILTQAFGVDPGKNFVYQLGAYVGGRYKAKLMENILLDNRFGVFSNYLKDPQNLVLAYSAILDLKVNRFISTQITADLFYDDNQIGKLQLKETLGVGLTYKFGKY